MARVVVGLPSLQGDIRTYKKRFDMVELHPVDMPTPRPATLRGWRKAVPPTFVFSVVLPSGVGALTPGAELDAALEQALAVAAAVEARCVVLRTPASVRPTATNRKRLAAVIERVPAEGVVRCWEPLGIWEPEDVLATARSIGALPVLDASREVLPPGPLVYTRLRALGAGSVASAAAIERVADQLRGRREAFVVVEHRAQAARIKAALHGALARRRDRTTPAAVIRPAAALPLVAEDEEQ